MGLAKLVCTGCSCLCDDIDVELQGNHIARITNACGQGAAYISASEVAECRSTSTINGLSTPVNEAISQAAHLLQRASSPLIFGLDRTTLEAQAVGIELAQSLGAVIDDNSSLHYGDLIQRINSGDLPTCSLSQVKDADLIIYWGANPQHSHPRHLSHFTYYAHERYREIISEPEVTLVSIDIRDTETSFLYNSSFKIQHRGDKDFINEILSTISGIGGTERSRALVQLMERSTFGVIFVGLGLNSALGNDFTLFSEMVHALGSLTHLAVIPMVDDFNMRGFTHLLYDKTGYVNSVNFTSGISHGENDSFWERIRNKASDCILVVASDIISSLPHGLIRNLRGTDIICITPFVTPTAEVAEVVIGTAVPGVETEGNALRMGGEPILLPQSRTTERPGDAEVLRQLLDRVNQ